MKRAISLLGNVLLPGLALAMFALAAWHVLKAQQPPPKVHPPIAPAVSPFGNTVAGSGIAEARTENISVGAQLPGIVTKVDVKVGDEVDAGTVLFEIDDRQAQADLEVRKAALASAQAQLKRLKSAPRPEELPGSEAKVREAKANFDSADDQLNRARKLLASKVMTQEEVTIREQAYYAGKALLAKAQADDSLLKAGTWEPDLFVQEMAVKQTEAEVKQMEIQIERLKVQALVPARVLQINVRPGEYVAAPSNTALIMLGDLQKLHVRVDIDEHDIPRFKPGAPARGSIRGAQHQEFPLTFVRVEPYVIPKKSLTGDNTERVDTRVLQVIYVIDNADQSVYVGQQLDVFIDVSAKPKPPPKPDSSEPGKPAAAPPTSVKSAARG